MSPTADPDLTLFGTAEEADSGQGVIGPRELTAGQTFHIGRLTSHPTLLVPGEFVAVHGRGPLGDSNGSGKTTWLAAVSLLLGDPQWQLSKGGRAAVDILFSPTAAGLKPGQYPAPDHGYVIGLFTHADPDVWPITVWLRINTSPRYVEVKWRDGIHLVDGDSDADRHRTADRLWRELGPAGDILGAPRYVTELYGTTPRCLAWVQKRGKLAPGPSLLHTAAGEFSPEEIGQALIELTGRAELLEQDTDARAELAENSASVAGLVEHDADATRREQEELDAVEGRAHARDALTDAQEARRRNDAKGLLEAVDRAREIDEEELPDLRARREEAVDELDAQQERIVELEGAEPDDDVADAQRAHDAANATLRARINEHANHEATRDALDEERRALADDAIRWDRRSLDEHHADVGRARDALTATEARRAIAEEAARRAREELDAAEHGRSIGTAGRLLALLADAGIDASLLVDLIDVDDDVRARWEARLHPLTDAVLVGPDDGEAATAIAAGVPGAVLVASGPGGDLPGGVREGSEEAARILTALERRLVTTETDTVVTDDEAGLVLVGGFGAPILGRDGRVAAALARLEEAQGDLEEAERARTQAAAALDAVDDGLRCAHAAERRAEVDAELAAVRERIAEAQSAMDAQQAVVDDTGERLVAARAAVAQLEERLEAARFRETTLREKLGRVDDEVRSKEGERRELRLDYWRQRWDGPVDEARELLADDDRSRTRLRNVANQRLADAQAALGLTSDGDGAPTTEIRSALRARGRQDDDQGDSTFDELTAALRDWLDSLEDADEVARARIESDRRRRAEEIEAGERELAMIRSGLADIQDAIEESIHRALAVISDKLDELDRAARGFGAELEITSIRPTAPEDTWTWHVTPRWRRRADGDMVAYTEQVNTAREKLFTIHLVLAALLGLDRDRTGSQVLILDELGDSLGDEHRREVLIALQTAAKEHGVTVLGTCQDSVLEEAARICGEILHFVHASDSHVLNQPTRMYAYDQDAARVRELARLADVGRPVL